MIPRSSAGADLRARAREAETPRMEPLLPRQARHRPDRPRQDARASTRSQPAGTRLLVLCRRLLAPVVRARDARVYLDRRRQPALHSAARGVERRRGGGTPISFGYNLAFMGVLAPLRVVGIVVDLLWSAPRRPRTGIDARRRSKTSPCARGALLCREGPRARERRASDRCTARRRTPSMRAPRASRSACAPTLRAGRGSHAVRPPWRSRRPSSR